MPYVVQRKDGDELNRLYEEDLPIHEWYRFVLSFPPHLVRHYIEKFSLNNDGCILDPFCGTGTTLVEAKKAGIKSIGVEANPIVHFAASVKTDWGVDSAEIIDHVNVVAEKAQQELESQGFFDLPLLKTNNNGSHTELRKLNPDQEKLLIKGSISPLPLHKTLVLLEKIRREDHQSFKRYAELALAKQLVYAISNLRFGPEVGVGKKKDDAPVVELWKRGALSMCEDLALVRQFAEVSTLVYHGDSRQLRTLLKPHSVDGIITSPPYPNEKDYSRTTRLESVLLGYTSTMQELRGYKKTFVRSNTRSVYKEDTDDQWVSDLPSVQDLAKSIDEKRIELKKTSGFEKLYGRVVRLYFGGMARHLEELKPVLKPGAKLAYVVGDQASYFQIMIRTGNILAEVADRLGYRVVDIDLFRTRFSTATKQNLREEVVLLEWEG